MTQINDAGLMSNRQPGFFVSYAIYSLLAYTIFQCYYSSRAFVIKYFHSVFIGKFSHTIRFCFFYWREYIPAFGNHILSIIFFETNKKMFWIAARRIIAFMTNYHTIRNFSIMDFPRKTMRSRFSPGTFSPSESSISFFIEATNPYPARILLRYIAPKGIYTSFLKHELDYSKGHIL